MNIAKEHIIIAVIAGIIAVALTVTEIVLKLRHRMPDKVTTTKKIRLNRSNKELLHTGLTVIACVVLALPGVTFAILAAVLFGPWWGLIMTAAVSVIQGITVSSSSGIIGIIMHFAATGGFVIVAGLIYTRGKNIKRAIIALVAGTLVQTALMVLMNLIFTPIFMSTPVETVIGMLIPVIIPFNLIKAGVNAILTFVVYKFVSRSVSALFD